MHRTTVLKHMANPVGVTYSNGEFRMFEQTNDIYIHNVLWEDIKNDKISKVNIWVEMLEQTTDKNKITSIHNETIRIEKNE